MAFGLTDSEEKQLITLLGKVQDKMSMEVFEAVAAKFVITAIETVILRRNENKDNQVETLLIPRPEGDMHWPGKLHTPGTILRESDFVNGSYDQAFARIQNKEIEVEFSVAPRFVAYQFANNVRGACNHLVFIAEIDNSKDFAGEFYPVDNLPSDFLEDQREMVEFAASRFLA